MKRSLAILLAVLALCLAGCGGDCITVRIPEGELPPQAADVEIVPIDGIARSSGKAELRFELWNNSERTILFDCPDQPAGVSFTLMKLVDGQWQCRRAKNVLASDTPGLDSLAPESARSLHLYPFQSVGRLGKGQYRVCCFFACEGEPDRVYGAYYEFTL